MTEFITTINEFKTITVCIARAIWHKRNMVEKEKEKQEKREAKRGERKGKEQQKEMKRAEGKRQKVTRVSKVRTSEWAKKGVKVGTQLDEESRQTEDVIKFRATGNGARMGVAKEGSGNSE